MPEFLLFSITLDCKDERTVHREGDISTGLGKMSQVCSRAGNWRKGGCEKLMSLGHCRGG